MQSYRWGPQLRDLSACGPIGPIGPQKGRRTVSEAAERSGGAVSDCHSSPRPLSYLAEPGQPAQTLSGLSPQAASSPATVRSS